MRDEQASIQTNIQTSIREATETAVSESFGAKAGPVDLQLLADKLYRLLREELRLEKARGANVTRRQNG